MQTLLFALLMAIARAQAPAHLEVGASPSANTIAASLSGVQPNSLVVVSVTVDSTHTISSVMDDLSVAGVLAIAGVDATAAQRKELWFFPNYGGGTRTFTATFNALATFRGIVVTEYSGVRRDSPLENTASATGSSAAPNSGNVTPSISGSLVVGAACGTNQPTFAAPFSEVFKDTTNIGDTSDYVQPTSAAVAATFTGTSGSWVALAAVFLAAPYQGGSVGTRGRPGVGPRDKNGFLKRIDTGVTVAAPGVVVSAFRRLMHPFGAGTGKRTRNS